MGVPTKRLKRVSRRKRQEETSFNTAVECAAVARATRCQAFRFADGCTVLLVLPQQGWLFSAPESRVTVEESVFLSAADGPRRSSQIVITGEVKRSPRTVWTLLRTEAPQAERREPPSGAQLPL